MKAVVIYESEFGATRAVAEAIARGLEPACDVILVDSRDATTGTDLIGGADLVVVGTPTHARMMPSARTRQEARSPPAAESPESWPEAPAGA